MDAVIALATRMLVQFPPFQGREEDSPLIEYPDWLWQMMILQSATVFIVSVLYHKHSLSLLSVAARHHHKNDGGDLHMEGKIYICLKEKVRLSSEQ